MSENSTANDNLSLSKQRKLQRKKDILKAKRSKKVGRIVWIAVLCLLAVAACFCVFFIGRNIITHVTMNNEYSKGLASNGHIEGVTAGDYVQLADYSNIKVPYADVEYTDENLQKAIDSLVAAKAEQKKDTEKAVEKDDVIVVEYKSYYEDGTEVTNGATGENGSTITVGSSSLKDYKFDDALIGKKIQDEPFTVEVEFPESYTANKDVAGKKIKYVVNIVSIKITPEFNDEFVQEYYKEKAETAEGYKAYLRETAERDNLESKVSEYITKNSTVNGYPKQYLKQVKSLNKYSAYQEYLYYNQLYYSYLGYTPYASFEAFIAETQKMSEAKYDRTKLVTLAKDQLGSMLIYQAIAEKENITASIEEYKAYATENGETAEKFESAQKTYGDPALVQQYLVIKINKFLADKATVVKE